jgi:hypothetical protein
MVDIPMVDIPISHYDKQDKYVGYLYNHPVSMRMLTTNTIYIT